MQLERESQQALEELRRRLEMQRLQLVQRQVGGYLTVNELFPSRVFASF